MLTPLSITMVDWRVGITVFDFANGTVWITCDMSWGVLVDMTLASLSQHANEKELLQVDM